MDSIKINELQIENVKRIKAVKIEPSCNGLTVIGGKNNQGKTSVLDAIAWALGGAKYKPSSAARDGSVVPPSLHITLSNGLVVERKGKNSDLKVIDPNGQKGGQQLLDGLVEQLALDLPRFMQANDKEKADTLLKIIGVGDRLMELDRKEKELYSNRHTVGVIADQKKKYAQEMTIFPDVPMEPVSASDLISRQQAILARNGERQRQKRRMEDITRNIERLRGEISSLQRQLQTEEQSLADAQRSDLDLQMESTEELEKDIREIEEINRKVRANLDKERAEDDAKVYVDQYTDLTRDIDQVRADRKKLLDGASLPLPGLSIDDGELVYNGRKWDSMSGSDQLRVSTAIVRKLNPNCGFVLLDKLEQMDIDTLTEFGRWLEAEGLQAIATRVSTGDECSIIIEDGYIGTADKPDAVTTAEIPKWKEGAF